MSPFEIVYGFNPASPIDFAPIPPAGTVSVEGEDKAEFIKKLHQKAKENIAKRTEAYAKQANKSRKPISFKEGDWVWLHLRPERFPLKRKNKLAPRGDGPFRVLKKINENAYQLELPGEFNVSSTFNVTDLELFDAGDDPVLRSKPSEGGGNDEDIDCPADDDEIDMGTVVPHVTDGPMTRLKARTIGHKFSQFVDYLMTHESAHQSAHQSARPSPKPADDHNVLTASHAPWELLSPETSASGVFTITMQ